MQPIWSDQLGPTTSLLSQRARRTPVTAKHEKITEALITDILGGRYRPGDRLPSERDLALRFASNRGSIREAMRRIQQLGLAEILPGGARVQERRAASLDVIGHLLSAGPLPDPVLADQILVVINALLQVAAEQILEFASDEEIEKIRALLPPLMKRDTTDAEHNQTRIALLRSILLSSQNLPLQLIARTLFEQLAPSLQSLADHVTLDRERYAAYARQLDLAFIQRDLPALRGIFDAFAQLNRESMLNAFANAQPGQEAAKG